VTSSHGRKYGICPAQTKLNLFAWRLPHNILPLKRKIEGTGIDLDTRCSMYLRLDEDASHILFKCKFAKKSLVQATARANQDRLGLSVFFKRGLLLYLEA
jgi:hypothetical protein